MVNLSFSQALSRLKIRLQLSSARLRQGLAAQPRRWTWAVLTPLALGILLLCAPVALAAIQLNYFNVIAYPASVTLEWSTASEVNLAGFDVQCKLASEPDSAFHEIGYVRAKGGPNVGALYTFNITSGVVPGVSYCFRLKEITTDGTPGDVIDRCGYGPMVTPTPGSGAIPVFTPIPVPTDAFGNPIVPTATLAAPVVPTVPTDAFGNPLPATPTLFAPPAVPTDAFGSPLATPVFPAAVATDAFGSPLPPPIAPPAVATDAFGNPIAPVATPAPVVTDAFGNIITVTPAPVVTDAFGNIITVTPAPVVTDAFGNIITPTVTPAPVVTDAFGNIITVTPAPVVTDAFGNIITPTVTPSQTVTVTQVAASAADAFTSPLAAVGVESLAAAASLDAANQAAGLAAAAVPVNVGVATPTPGYIVVTATPTPAPVALAPVLTPLPTATPAPAGIQLASTLDAGQNLTQNLLIMLLCLTFTGASGIGIVGLITSVMFMRSRSSQRDFYEQTNVRRRL